MISIVLSCVAHCEIKDSLCISYIPSDINTKFRLLHLHRTQLNSDYTSEVNKIHEHY